MFARPFVNETLQSLVDMTVSTRREAYVGHHDAPGFDLFSHRPSIVPCDLAQTVLGL